MASLQSISCEILKHFMEGTCLFEADSETLDVANMIIKEAVGKVVSKIIDEPTEVKAKAFKPYFNIAAMLNVGLSRRMVLDNTAPLIPIKSSVIPSSSSAPKVLIGTDFGSRASIFRDDALALEGN